MIKYVLADTIKIVNLIKPQPWVHIFLIFCVTGWECSSSPTPALQRTMEILRKSTFMVELWASLSTFFMEVILT